MSNNIRYNTDEGIATIETCEKFGCVEHHVLALGENVTVEFHRQIHVNSLIDIDHNYYIRTFEKITPEERDKVIKRYMGTGEKEYVLMQLNNSFTIVIAGEKHFTYCPTVRHHKDSCSLDCKIYQNIIKS